MEYLLVDGYNIINAWGDIFNVSDEPLADSRDKLLEILSNYQGYKKINVIVVFDAHMVKGSMEKVENYDNITVVYTKENESADNYIERFVYKMGSTHTVRVATSDYLQQTMILSSGGIRMSQRELREEINAINKNIREEIAGDLKKNNTIMSNINKELLEKLEKMRRSKF